MPLPKYANPDFRCLHPKYESHFDYCWSYAHHVDGTKGYEDMGPICRRCEFWRAVPPVMPQNETTEAR